jgi:hypothetical protein
MHNLRSMILAGAAVVAVAVLLAPSTVAQGAPNLDVTVTPPAGQIKPEIESGQLRINVKYTTGNQAQPLVSAQNQQVAINFQFNCQFGVVVTGPTQKFIVVNAAPNSVNQVDANFQITIPRSAPGLQAIPCSVTTTGSALLQTAVPAPTPRTDNFQVTADYYSLSQVQLASKLKQSGPQKQVPFEMTITNFGNARTQYTFELGAQPGGKWNALIPEVLLLDSPNSGQGSPTNTAVFTVATPFKNGWNNEEGAYQIVIKPSAADDSSKTGNPLTANMLVRVRGVYVPGLEPFVLLGAILGSALLLRLRKDE